MTVLAVANIAYADDQDETGHGQTRDACRFGSRVDDPHVSANGTDVCGHSWWQVRSGTCPSHARVKSWLYQWTCDSVGNNCSWVEIDDDNRVVRPGGGAGRRTDVRRTCVTFDSTGYMNKVDVDLIGFIDPDTQFYRINNANCRITGYGRPHDDGSDA